MKRITVLGCGLVGSAIVHDLSSNAEIRVTAVDARHDAIGRIRQKENVEFIQAQLGEEQNLAEVVKEADLVVNALPGFMGYSTLKSLIRLRKNVVDISFMPENFLELDEFAREQEVTVVADMGVAPGMSHMLAARGVSMLDKATEVLIYVGGLPRKREWPFEYKAVFSPADVLEEYTRPARLRRNGKIMEMKALSERELLHFEPLGTLEAFNSDGLRSLLQTLDVPNMAEKTLRYKGHAELMEIFRECGFFSQQPILINGQTIKPLELTSHLLFERWRLNPGEVDYTIMRIQVKGIKDSQPTLISYDLVDEYDPKEGIHSMARTTGFAATAVADLILKGSLTHWGVLPPEWLGQKKEYVDQILKYLSNRNVNYHLSIQTLQ
ncbi:MAG: NAD-dependent epimerase/dehydratase family protein [Bacteroidales bacterium]|jgi:saccharopine dehydrogenase-like NADP-dependent oxidoreductase|nr:NAD-dependent epimerase/dehydratase family protein [Bacteroidales bacterium]NPV37310.1 NAD-dependent epimerase/dehydratase family protein [Bacteroidales bacterium]